MKKQLYILMASVAILFPAKARADFEIVQQVITTVEVVQDKSSVVLQKFAAAKEQVQSVREGQSKGRGLFGDAIKKFKSKLGLEKKLVAAVNPEASNVNDQKKTEEDIEKNMLLQAGQGDETAKSQEYDERMKLIHAENIAALYAKAFTTRVGIAKEEVPELDRSNSQDILRATSAMSDSIARRYVSILDLDAAYLEFYATDLSKEYSGGGDEDSADAKSPAQEGGKNDNKS